MALLKYNLLKIQSTKSASNVFFLISPALLISIDEAPINNITVTLHLLIVFK